MFLNLSFFIYKISSIYLPKLLSRQYKIVPEELSQWFALSQKSIKASKAGVISGEQAPWPHTLPAHGLSRYRWKAKLICKSVFSLHQRPVINSTGSWSRILFFTFPDFHMHSTFQQMVYSEARQGRFALHLPGQGIRDLGFKMRRNTKNTRSTRVHLLEGHALDWGILCLGISKSMH